MDCLQMLKGFLGGSGRRRDQDGNDVSVIIEFEVLANRFLMTGGLSGFFY